MPPTQATPGGLRKRKTNTTTQSNGNSATMASTSNPLSPAAAAAGASEASSITEAATASGSYHSTGGSDHIGTGTPGISTDNSVGQDPEKATMAAFPDSGAVASPKLSLAAVMSAKHVAHKIKKKQAIRIGLASQGGLTAHPDHLSLRATVTLITGFVFGFALNKAGVYRAEIIRAQMMFADNTMLQVFLVAAAFSTASIAVLHYAKYHEHVDAAGTEYHSKLEGTPAVLFGAFLLGSGMMISGSCPGTSYAQLGAGSIPTLITLGGAVVGAALYGYTEPFWRRFKRWMVPTYKTLYEMMGVSRLVTAAMMTLMFLGAAIGAGYLPLNKPQDVVVERGAGFFGPGSLDSNNPLALMKWSPFVAGPIIGMMQLPLSMFLEKNLGCSSTFQWVAANVLRLVPFADKSEYTRRFRGGFNIWWQVLLVLGVIAGSATSMATAQAQPENAGIDVWYKAPLGVSPLAGFFGGALMVFGGRLANGCTSGHGISGCGHQGLNSYAAVGGMFAGGIATAFAFYV